MKPELITLLIAITVFVLKFSLGFNTNIRHLTYFKDRKMLLIKSLLAVVVLVPILAVLLIKIIDPGYKIAATILLLSASPGAPLASYKSYKAGGHYAYSISLQMWLTMLVIFTLPLTLLAFDQVLDLNMEVSPWKVAPELGYAVLLPFGLGLVAGHLLPNWVDAYGRALAKIANIFLLLLGLLLIIGLFELIKQSEGFTIFGFAVFILLSLVAGHFLGGPDPKSRTTLATFCYTRNVGIAMFVASQHVAQPAVLAMVVPYMVVALIISLLYNSWRKQVSS